MSTQKFILKTKSTIDYLTKQLADSEGVEFVDLDAALLDAERLASDATKIGWSFGNMWPDPTDPLWSVEFDIGAITSNDPAQYTSLDLVSVVADLFARNGSHLIKDYSGDSAPTTVDGVLSVVFSGVSPQQVDRASGVRLARVICRAQRMT